MSMNLMVDLDRCIGCWTCSMICKMGWHLSDDDYRVTVLTHGSGAGIDRPQGEYPSLRMNWQPVFLESCTFCAPRIAEGEIPFCVHNCPTQAISYGDPLDKDSTISEMMDRCKSNHYNITEAKPVMNSKDGVIYATRE